MMPRVGINSQSFEPQEVAYLSPEQGGRLGSVRAGTPVWTMNMDLNNMLEPNADIWRAWVSSQRGSGRLFYAYELGREVPRFHRGGTPFTAAPSGWSQTINSDGTALLSLQGLMRGMYITPGDYVGFRWDGWKRSLVRAVEAAKVGTDGVATFAIEPPVHRATPAGATANLNGPDCLMRLNSANTKIGRQVIGYTSAGSTISAAQDIVP
jgi:hypothetical protein